MRKSVAAGILVMFAGYAVASYGYVLIRGWDIPFRAWVDPLHAYVWAGTPNTVPLGQVFPSSLAVQAATTSTAGGGG